jgi:hypothetical protein
MNSPAIIGIGAGLVSAVLFLSTATGSLLAMMLFFVVALPGFIAGLGWGSLAALIAGLSSAAAVAVIISPAAGLVYLLVLGIPVALLAYLALLARKPEGDAAAEPEKEKVEWYPPGRLVAWSTVVAGCIAAFSVPLLGFDAETYRANAKSYFDKTIFSELPTTGPNAVNREQLEPLVDLLVQVLPATSAMVWLAILLTNMWAAGRILEASGHAIRPCPRLGTLTYPRHFPLGFVAALLASFTPGIAGIVATGFAGAFLFAYILMGLVVLHVLARRSAFSGLLLTVLYLAMLFMGWVALLVAIVGLGEPVFRLRERFTGGSRLPQNKDE